MKNRKKVMFLAVALSCVAGLGTVGCGPSKADRLRMEQADSIRLADSIARVEAEAEAARIEQARQDSIIKDSIIRSKIPQMKDLIEKGAWDGVSFNKFINISKKLKKQGYDETVNTRWVPGYEEMDYYVEGHNEKDYVWSYDSIAKIKVMTGEDSITLTFGDEYSQQLFMESVKAAGFKKGKGEYGGLTGAAPDHRIQGTVYHHPKGKDWSGVWVDETPGKVFLIYCWRPN